LTKKKLKPQTLLAPVPAALISCGREGEEPNVITLAWVGVVNSEPPMVSIAIRPGRHSYNIIKDTGEFVVNVPRESQAEMVDACGTLSGRNVNKFSEFNLTPLKGELQQAPAVSQCPISLECVVRQVIPLGTHHLFLGEVQSVLVDEDICDAKGNVDFQQAAVLGFAGGQYLGVQPLGHAIGFSVKKRKAASRSGEKEEE
jgi:flavin reductase (DIM6/NTAB) family NADH-FMN oxidoreductase RutF